MKKIFTFALIAFFALTFSAWAFDGRQGHRGHVVKKEHFQRHHDRRHVKDYRYQRYDRRCRDYGQCRYYKNDRRDWDRRYDPRYHRYNHYYRSAPYYYWR